MNVNFTKQKFSTCFFWVVLGLGILLLFGCASPHFSLKPDVTPKSLELCLDFAAEMSSEDKLYHLDAVKEFIFRYNALSRDIRLTPCAGGKIRTVRLIVENTHFVLPKEQSMYVLISVLGIAYPLSGGGFGFVWFGLNTTSLGVQFSPDIADMPNIVYTQFSSSPFFYDKDSVKIKHMKQFQAFMFELFDNLKKSES